MTQLERLADRMAEAGGTLETAVLYAAVRECPSDYGMQDIAGCTMKQDVISHAPVFENEYPCVRCWCQEYKEQCDDGQGID